MFTFTHPSEMTSEEVTAKRRADRRQFKLDRAKAISAVAAEAESAFEIDGRVVTPSLSGPSIPSGATWRPVPVSAEEVLPPPDELLPANVEEEPIEDVEHLQLTLPEAFFLIWNFDCLTVLDPSNVSPLHIQEFRHLTWIKGRADGPTSDLAVIPANTSCIVPRNIILISHQRRSGSRQSIPNQLHGLPPLPRLGLGNQRRYQVLRRLSALQTGSSLFARRVSRLLYYFTQQLTTSIGSLSSFAQSTRIRWINKPLSLHSRMPSLLNGHGLAP